MWNRDSFETGEPKYRVIWLIWKDMRWQRSVKTGCPSDFGQIYFRWCLTTPAFGLGRQFVVGAQKLLALFESI